MSENDSSMPVGEINRPGYMTPHERRIDRPRDELPTIWQLLDHAEAMDTEVAALLAAIRGGGDA